MSEPSRRLFFALWPSSAERARLLTAVAPAVVAADGREVVPPNLHVTLVFLGSVGNARLEAVRQVAAGVVATPVSLVLDTIELWPKPRILCATSSEPVPAADALARTLAQGLVERGFAPDLRPFRAHVTLKRKVAHVMGRVQMPGVALRFSDFVLVESRTDPAGPIYSSLGTWALYETPCPTEKP